MELNDKNIINQIPKLLRALVAEFCTAHKNAEVYLVGGAVRDLFLERNTKDYDLVVRSVPADILEAWLASHGEVNLVGKHFGVFKWRPVDWLDEDIDVALPRTEHVLTGTGEYRDFAVQSDHNLPIADDLKRRDFTINAIALNIMNGEIVDPNNGQDDITKKIIRAVGNPIERFTEDLSRVLRGLRFACQLDFTIEPITLLAIKETAAKAAIGNNNDEYLVPREIVSRELLKSLLSNPVLALEIWDESSVLKYILPEVEAMKHCPQAPQFHSEGDVFVHTKLALSSLGGDKWQEFFGNVKPSLMTIVGILLHDIGKPPTLQTPEKDGVDRIRTNNHDAVGATMATQICERLKLTSYVDPVYGQVNQDDLVWIIAHHLLIAHSKNSELRPSTLYRYFLLNPERGLIYQQVMFADLYATVTQDKLDLTQGLKDLRQKVAELAPKLTQGKLKLLLSGNDIMKLLNIIPGPQVGKLLRVLETAQLEGVVKTKEEAEEYITKILNLKS